jgi:signal transduction histidine kinase
VEPSRELRRSEERLRLALEAGKLGSWEFNIPTGRLTASAQCKANHGLPPDADLQLETNLIPSIELPFREPFRAAVAQAIESQGSFDIEFAHRWPDGTSHWLLVKGRVVDPETMLGITIDVTERRRNEEEVRDSDRRKTEFLAVVAHELRNPLAPILTAARLLQLKGPRDPQLDRARDTIVRQTLQLTKVVEDLLDVGRVTMRKLRLEKARIDVNTVVKQAAETCAPAIDGKRHTLHVNCAPHPVYADADASRMVQVLCNLLNNAAKYTRDGGRIEMSCSREGTQAVVRVRDNGVGLAPEMLEGIFQPFVQIGASRHHADGGLGIGLSLAKAIVDMHDGTIQARSDGIAAGSEFIVRLPAVPES